MPAGATGGDSGGAVDAARGPAGGLRGCASDVGLESQGLPTLGRLRLLRPRVSLGTIRRRERRTFGVPGQADDGARAAQCREQAQGHTANVSCSSSHKQHAGEPLQSEDALPSRYASAQSTRTGLTSTTGVPSMASIGPIPNRVPEISRTVTRCSPNGFGRCGDRVVNIPASGISGSPRGCTLSTSRSAR